MLQHRTLHLHEAPFAVRMHDFQNEFAAAGFAQTKIVVVLARKRVRDSFFPKEALNPDRITGLDTIVNDAVELKYTETPLTKEQLAELIQIPPR